MLFNAVFSALNILSVIQILGFLAQPAVAVNMSLYRPEWNVDPLFGFFLQSFYTQAEATTDVSIQRFENYFASNCNITLGGVTEFSGKAGAGIFKVAITGGSQFNHYPQKGYVVDSSKIGQITLGVDGSAKATDPSGVCVATTYTTYWRLKTVLLIVPVLAPEQSQILELILVKQAPITAGCNSF